MKILYDGFIYSAQTAGGVNRYFSNIIKRLPQDFYPVLTAPKRSKFNFPEHPNLKKIGFPQFQPHRLSAITEKIYYYLALKTKGSFNLQHPTFYSMLTPNKFNPVKAPVVRTVYDMINERYPAIYDPASYRLLLKRKTIKEADFIICISENTKKDLIDFYAIPEEKIQVIYLATEFQEEMAFNSMPVPPEPYFLFVGSREAKYKNFDGALEAFAPVSKKFPEVRLAIVGPKLNEIELKYISELDLTGKICEYGYVADNHLAKLYHQSIAFIYPSLYEGFGIPPLEAMACGALVITTGRASLPEVVGDAAIFFDPDNRASLSDILEQIVRGYNRREEFLARGKERAKLFSWDKTADQTIELYRKLGN